MELFTLILLLGAISHHWTTAIEFRQGNYFVNINNGVLLEVKGTGDLDLSNLGIEQIGPNVFDRLDVKHLNLSNNRITKIPKFIFSNLTNLETLSLANNEIQLQSGIFFGLKNLKTLNLTRTGLLTLEHSNLFGIPKTAYVIVDGNRLRAIHSTIFEPQILSETPAVVSRSKKSIEDFGSSSEEDVELQVCKTDNGTLESVAVVTRGHTRSNCMKRYHRIWSYELSLEAVGFNGAVFGWCKITGAQFSRLNLDNNNISEITPELLAELPKSVNWVQINENKIAMIKRNVINNSHIKTLKLERNDISTIESGALEEIQLEELYLMSNYLKNVDFARTLPTSILHLDVSINNITEIPGGSFAPLQNLCTLNMTHNEINHLNVGAFQGLRKVEVMDLSFNQLENIDPGTFDNLAKLRYIALASNKISTIDSELFSNVTSLDRIDLKNNRITTISANSFSALKNKWAYELDLSFNKINFIEEGSFANMILLMLKLTGNTISEQSIAKGAFDGSHITELYLDHNSMTKINGDSFYGIKKVHMLLLNGNNISSIEKGAAEYLGSVTNLYLSMNPLEIIKNGAFYGLTKKINIRVWLIGVPLKGIHGGTFDDV